MATGVAAGTSAAATSRTQAVAGSWGTSRGCALRAPRLRLGGINLSDVNPGELRRRIVLLPQEGHVLAENLRLVPGEHTGTDLIATVAAAGLDGWLARLPDGLATVLHGRDGNLSAGERRLVAHRPATAARYPRVVHIDDGRITTDPHRTSLVRA